MLKGHADAALDFGELNLSGGAAAFGNILVIGEADVDGFAVEFAVKDAAGGTSATFSVEGSTDGSSYTEIAVSPAVALANLKNGVSVALPRGAKPKYLKAKIKSVAGSFTAGKAHALLDTYVGK